MVTNELFDQNEPFDATEVTNATEKNFGSLISHNSADVLKKVHVCLPTEHITFVLLDAAQYNAKSIFHKDTFKNVLAGNPK